MNYTPLWINRPLPPEAKYGDQNEQFPSTFEKRVDTGLIFLVIYLFLVFLFLKLHFQKNIVKVCIKLEYWIQTFHQEWPFDQINVLFKKSFTCDFILLL